MKSEVSYRAKITWMVDEDDRLHFKNVNSVDPQPIIEAYSCIKDEKGVHDLKVRIWKTTVEEVPFYM